MNKGAEGVLVKFPEDMSLGRVANMLERCFSKCHMWTGAMELPVHGGAPVTSGFSTGSKVSREIGAMKSPEACYQNMLPGTQNIAGGYKTVRHELRKKKWKMGGLRAAEAQGMGRPAGKQGNGIRRDKGSLCGEEAEGRNKIKLARKGEMTFLYTAFHHLMRIIRSLKNPPRANSPKLKSTITINVNGKNVYAFLSPKIDTHLC